MIKKCKAKGLLVDALYRAWHSPQEIASMAVIVDAIDDHAVRFYQHYHFLSLEGQPYKLYLPMKEIKQFIK